MSSSAVEKSPLISLIFNYILSLESQLFCFERHNYNYAKMHSSYYAGLYQEEIDERI